MKNTTLENFMNDVVFNKLISNLGIEPATKQTNVERFYEWLQMCGNVHLNNHEALVKGFNKIPNI